MSPDTKMLVRATWQGVVPMADAVARLFYDNLFGIDPRLRALFVGVDLDVQRRKLVQALALVVESLDRIDGLVPVLEGLGRRHATYGVADAHYETVGMALISTLRQGLGDTWTEAAEAAWIEAYALVSGVMRAAGAEARAGQADSPSMSPLPSRDATPPHVG